MVRPELKTPSHANEEATRQQGGLFFRENSSNGGKAIRTFWRNTKFAKIRCQGLNIFLISHYLGISYRGYSSYNSRSRILLLFAFAGIVISQTTMNQLLRRLSAPSQVHLPLPARFRTLAFQMDLLRLAAQIDPQKFRLCCRRLALHYSDRRSTEPKEKPKHHRRQH